MMFYDSTPTILMVFIFLGKIVTYRVSARRLAQPCGVFFDANKSLASGICTILIVKLNK